MYKIKYILVILATILLTIGCTNTKTYDKAIEEGKLAICNSNYNTAEKMFSLAIEENKNDKEAKGLYEQTKKLIQVNELIDKAELENSLKLCEDILKIDTISNVVKDEVKKIKQDIIKKVNIDREKLIIGDFEKYLYYDISMFDNSAKTEFTIYKDSEEEEKASLDVGINTQAGMKAMLIIGEAGINLMDNCVVPEYALDNSGDLKEGYKIEVGIKDLNNDNCKDIIIACGDGIKALEVNIILLQYSAGEIIIDNIGNINGQTYTIFNDDGTIDVSFGSQGYVDTYIIEGFEIRDTRENKIVSNKNDKDSKTLCICGKNYIEDNKQWIDEDKCDSCINEVILSHSDNYSCVVCGEDTDMLCQYDECKPFCKDDMGYYCDCGEYHHRQELCPVYDI